MGIVGLITEYNPFHNGHLYHIEQAKRLTGCEHVIVIMSGNFVQRGTPAIIPKHMRVKMALEHGASLVIELPVCYATGSAEYFAFGAVSILEKLGCIDAICFGSECGNLTMLEKTAAVLCEEPTAFTEILNIHLRLGESFPSARQKALSAYFASEEYNEVLSEPNNILGIEYLKALYRLKSNIKPYTLKRKVSHYHDTQLQENYSSASAIRTQFYSGNLHTLKNQMPENCISLLEQQYQKRFPVFADDFSLILKYRLLQESKDSLTTYADVSKDLANRIDNCKNQYKTFSQFCELLKTKEVTYSRISRALTHILLEITKDDYQEIGYARMLGFKKSDVAVLTSIKEHSSIPLISKLANTDSLSPLAKQMLKKDLRAADLYESVITDKFQTDFINEYKHPMVCI